MSERASVEEVKSAVRAALNTNSSERAQRVYQGVNEVQRHVDTIVPSLGQAVIALVAIRECARRADVAANHAEVSEAASIMNRVKSGTNQGTLVDYATQHYKDADRHLTPADELISPMLSEAERHLEAVGAALKYFEDVQSRINDARHSAHVAYGLATTAEENCGTFLAVV